ncbi:MAG: hypothetical protein V7697_28900 [Rhodococcus erythropolis]
MASWKTNTAIVAGTAVMVFGALSALGPDQSANDDRRDHLNQQLDELSDADQSSKDRMRENGMDGIDMENKEKLLPRETLPHIRIRLP